MLVRAKLMGIRYFPSEADGLFSTIGSLLVQRVMAGDGAEDVASMLGLEIDASSVASVLVSALQ